MTPAQLSGAVLHALRCAVANGELSLTEGGALPERVVVESPARRGAGDYSTGVAFQLARSTGRSAGELATLLGERLVRLPGVSVAEVSGPGFVNVTLSEDARAALLDEVRAAACAISARPTSARASSVPPSSLPLISTSPVSASPSSDADMASGAGSEEQPVVGAVEGSAGGGPGGPGGLGGPGLDIARWAAVTGDDPEALAVWTERSSALFRVQYAHARARELLRGAERLGLSADAHAEGELGGAPPVAAPARASVSVPAPAPASAPAPVSASVLSEGAARELWGLFADFERVSATGGERLARYLEAVAGAFCDFREHCPPLPSGEEKPGAVHRARLVFVETAAAVLAGGLTRLGVTAPERI